MATADYPTRYQVVGLHNVADSPSWAQLDTDVREAVEVVGRVLPFRTNRYVIDHLIDWSRVPDDPIFQLVFPQRQMLDPARFAEIRDLLRPGVPADQLAAAVNEIRLGLNPHPAGQMTHNVPALDDRPLQGVQHKYRETVLFFPSAGQTCHAYCTYCFRWAQFVGLEDLKFEASEPDDLVKYLKAHPEVTDVLITGGDPMVMRTRVLRRFIEPLLSPDLDHVQNIRIGTKAIAYWPQRFVSDEDADDCLRLFEEVVAAGPASGADGALLASGGARARDCPTGRAADPKHWGSDPHAGSAHPSRQRRSRRLGRAVAHRCSPRDDSVLHVHRARHRRAQLFRGATHAVL